MLVASGLTGLDLLNPEGLANLPRSSCRSRYGGSVEPTFIARHFCRRPVPSGGRFRFRKTFTFHLAVPRSVFRLPFRSAVLPCRSRASLHSFRAVQNRPSGCAPPPHLRFARFVPRNARGVFSDVAAGIAAASFGLDFLVPFQGFPPSKVRANHPLDRQKLRLKSESRKKNLSDLSTGRRIAVEKLELVGNGGFCSRKNRRKEKGFFTQRRRDAEEFWLAVGQSRRSTVARSGNNDVKKRLRRRPCLLRVSAPLREQIFSFYRSPRAANSLSRAYLSRAANRRNRRALSRIKPAASF
jgi:hypothetical protein